MPGKLTTALLFAALVVVPADAAAPFAQQSNSSIPNGELARLRPVVVPDLKAFLSRFDGEPVSNADAVQEFRRCTFTRLNLGTLGRAIVVEAAAGHGNQNAAFLNVYVREHESFRRLLTAAGFGPEVNERKGAPPDLIFGWTEGVCTAKYYRYHYANGQYERNGCVQENSNDDPKVGEYCALKACDDKEKLAAFDPPGNRMPEDEIPKPDGPSCVVTPVLEPAQAGADSTQPAPHNQVRFLLTPRTSGDCNAGPGVEGGSWKTSDPVNTSVDARGLVTCVHPTPASAPAIITFLGTFKNHAFAPASLSCK